MKLKLELNTENKEELIEAKNLIASLLGENKPTVKKQAKKAPKKTPIAPVTPVTPVQEQAPVAPAPAAPAPDAPAPIVQNTKNETDEKILDELFN